MRDTSQWRPLALSLGTLLPALLFVSWLYPPTRALWDGLDQAAFWAMNRSLAEGRWWQGLWAIANNRGFDLAAAGGMFALFAHYVLIHDRRRLRYFIAVGLMMSLTIVIAMQIGKAIPIERPSATALYPEALRLSQLVPEIPTKDVSGDSFPGDHGLVLLLFAGFVLRYLPRGYGVLALALAVLFTTPRLMSGAHWLSDELVGALALGTLVLTWLFATPLHGWALKRIRGWIGDRGRA
ncbi:MAG: hypothetical protein B0D96_10615 [Candidatus Sedimenticola endophacoides]|uniref:Phosphatidic acid phosphatase type 2/haloperoxidase domain-containing protein n=1 Tax=Candidatus Sedimenticola endophacoides TaxID=2548426 RepID=A0A657PJS8_9GAMM|nr:MAG: hypothetical protein B0D94_10325 [Candidatus Sedimenticola endophacoides]OQX33911.1 MAG: hypothetical protein B0D96_10615 [Candidatus Sedimenticola endophacoides]OQX34454.1 MAG: hypothetical protein B0D84_03430 [Candidatus Sedimenticola endophacoides]OQX40814.1 MAG: hypothetical protein B0D89_06350 [Candidatus Sedimenticola endophacoides]OQX42133.1 MAG: hypothetical protein B0D88_07005 [Candidatus Sedimenticola endophacoides]